MGRLLRDAKEQAEVLWEEGGASTHGNQHKRHEPQSEGLLCVERRRIEAEKAAAKKSKEEEVEEVTEEADV